MKFLHTSDWHLGRMGNGGLSYRDDQKFFIDRICEIAVSEKVDGILLAGDVFDKSIASQDALKLYDEATTYICGTLGIPLYLIAGNHDGAERISQCNELLKKSGLFIVGTLEETPQCVNVGDVDIYFLPWISTDRVRSVYPKQAEEVTGMEAAYQIALDHYREAFVPGHKNILISHAYIVNGETSTSDKAAEIGMATMVPSGVFDGFDYVALGHLHGPQKINDRIYYSGTPMAYSFGKEENQEKSVIILDTDTMEKKVVPLEVLHKRSTLSGTFDELMAAEYDDRTRGGYVKLDVTDSYIGMESIAAFRERYPNLLELSGKRFDREDETITMTIEEFEHVENDPESVFTRFCEDVLETTPSERQLRLFRDAVDKYGKGEM